VVRDARLPATQLSAAFPGCGYVGLTRHYSA
jgi:hypothetical protein